MIWTTTFKIMRGSFAEGDRRQADIEVWVFIIIPVFIRVS